MAIIYTFYRKLVIAHNDCTHTHEVGCSVLAAVKSGRINEAHYQDYMKLNKESEHYKMSYLKNAGRIKNSESLSNMQRNRIKEMTNYQPSTYVHICLGNVYVDVFLINPS